MSHVRKPRIFEIRRFVHLQDFIARKGKSPLKRQEEVLCNLFVVIHCKVYAFVFHLAIIRRNVRVSCAYYLRNRIFARHEDVTAFFFYPIFCVVLYYFPEVAFLRELLLLFTYYLFAYSLSFCVFNLLPLYPLDGFRIVDAVNKRRGKVYRFLRNYGYYILLGLILESFICRICVNLGAGIMDYFNILGWFMTFATGILGWPVTALWGLVPW